MYILETSFLLLSLAMKDAYLVTASVHNSSLISVSTSTHMTEDLVCRKRNIP